MIHSIIGGSSGAGVQSLVSQPTGLGSIPYAIPSCVTLGK